MRFSNRTVFRTTRVLSFMLMKKTIQKVLMNNLGLTSDEAKHVTKMNEKIFTYPQHRVINNCEMLQKYNVRINSFAKFGYCMAFKDWKLEHRINILKDLGVQNIDILAVTRLIFFLGKSVSSFKQYFNIPAHQDLKENIFNRFGGSIKSVSVLDPLLKNDLLVKEYYNICLLYCKSEIFDLPLSDDTLYNTSKYKSISMIAEILKVLRNDLGCDDEYIKNNPTVIDASAENVKSILNNFKDTGLYGKPIIEVLKKNPYLLFVDVNNMNQLIASFKRYKIPDDYVRKYMTIFTLGNDVFIERMQRILKHPDLRIWRKYPRILQLIYHQNMAEDRLEYLRYFNHIKWARLHTVLSNKCNIEKNMQYSCGTVMKSKFLKYLLETELGPERSYLIKDLKKHPYWRIAGYTDIEKTLIYLKEHFTIDEICANIHVVLYTPSTIEKLITDLKKQYSQKGYSLTNSQYLALCLYTLEKDNNFTGDSIWNYGHSSTPHLKSLSSSRNQSQSATDKDIIDIDNIKTLPNSKNSNIKNM